MIHLKESDTLYETKSDRCNKHMLKLEVFLWLTVN